MVAGRGQHSDAAVRRTLQFSVHGCHGVPTPSRLRTSPTDGEDGRMMGSVVRGCCNCMDEALSRIGTKVHDDFGCRGDRARAFNIELHFSISAVRVTDLILRTINTHPRYAR